MPVKTPPIANIIIAYVDALTPSPVFTRVPFLFGELEFIVLLP